MSAKPTYASVIKNRGFRSLWINQILVQMAFNTLNFALIVWVFKLVDSNLAVSALLLAIYLPSVIFGIFAGVFVDIIDRRKIILMIDFILALAFLAFVFIRGSYPLILLNTFLINSLAQFFMPSESSSIPMLVSKKQLFLANSLFSLTLYGAFMTGYSIGGPILNSFGINAVFLLGAVSLLVAFILAQKLPIIKVSRTDTKLNRSFSLPALSQIMKLTVREAKSTFRFIHGRFKVEVAIGLLSAAQGVIGVLAVMMPSYLEKVLKIHATDASYFVMLPLGLGMVSGAYLLGRLFHGVPRRLIVLPAVMLAGALLVLIGLIPDISRLFQSTDLPSYVPHPRYFFRAPSLSSILGTIAFALGFCTVAIIVPSQTVLQESTNEQNRGKIFAVLAVLMTAFSAVPVVIAGGLSDLFGVTPIFVALGLLVLTTGILASRPGFFFKEHHLPLRVREFLGFGHWAEEG